MKYTKTIAFSNRKGGVGKTSISLGVATILAKRGYDVLLVDLESQNNLTTGLLSPRQLSNQPLFLYDAIIAHMIEGFVFPPPIVQVRQHLFIAPSSRKMTGVEIKLANFKQPLMVFKELFSSYQGKMDYIIMDCPPGAGLVTLNAYMATDYLFVPALMEDDSLVGAIEVCKDIKAYIQNYKPKFWISGIIFNQYDLRARLCRSVKDNFEKCFPGRIMNTHIRRSIAVGEAKRNYQGVAEYAPDCNAAKDMETLVDEILSRIGY